MAAPNVVSPGETVNIGVLFQNVLTETLNDAIIVLEIPWRAEYHYSTQDGQFWSVHNHVIWKLGDVEPGETFSAIAQVHFKWWTPNFTPMSAAVMFAANNMRNSRVTYEEHLEYEEIKIASEQQLTQGQVDNILANDAELKALYDHVLSQGFKYYGNAKKQTLSDGVEWFEMLLVDSGRLGEIVAVQRIDNVRHIHHETDTYVSQYTLTGGARFDFDTAEWEFWGDLMPSTSLSTSAKIEPTTGCGLASTAQLVSVDLTQAPALDVFVPSFCPHHNWGDCLRNCLINDIPKEMANTSNVIGSSSCDACAACEVDCLNVCSDCARDLWKDNDKAKRYHDCTDECDDSENWNNYQCDENRVMCYDAPKNESVSGRSQYRLTYKCDGDTCKYEPNPILEYCPEGCAAGDTAGSIIKTECIECEDIWDFISEAQCIRSLSARDPNALYGPLTATPGQTIEYTVEWENEGQGTAYGVFVESTLPPELDDSTLTIIGNGVYYPGSRTILWRIGELAAGAGDTETFSVQVPVSTLTGTVMVAEATVYIPSVPEVTPTNPVVTVVQNIAANGQMVETDGGVPVDITLSGYSPSGKPLVYDIIRDPMNGTLTGTAPNLTYTPGDNFGGMDGFNFTVSDGVDKSLPAIVTVIVNYTELFLPFISR